MKNHKNQWTRQFLKKRGGFFHPLKSCPLMTLESSICTVFEKTKNVSFLTFVTLFMNAFINGHKHVVKSLKSWILRLKNWNETFMVFKTLCQKCAKKVVTSRLVGYFLARVYYFMDLLFFGQLCKKQSWDLRFSNINQNRLVMYFHNRN